MSDAEVRALLDRQAVRTAFRVLETQFEETVYDTIALTEIPAPPYKEQARARAVLERLQREPGLRNVQIDDEGNVIAERPGLNGGPTIALAAHLDTVFPEGTDTRVTRNGTLFRAPGIGDDSYGLASLLAVIRAMNIANIRTRANLLFIADVGEEGLGNLRGMHYLFEKGPYRRRIDTFVSIDGPDDSSIINGAVVSKRYRVTFTGPGGHSYGAFGLVSPAYAMAGAVARLSRMRVPKVPKTTYNVGLYGGGTSVNSIPSSVWMEVDLRSESEVELNKVEQQLMAIVRLAAADENRVRSTALGPVMVNAKLVGERKGGKTPYTSPVVQTALAVSRVMGKQPMLRASSTDSNVPISLGIPAITIGAGTRGGGAHSLSEWIDLDKNTALPGLQRVMLLTLALAGVE